VVLSGLKSYPSVGVASGNCLMAGNRQLAKADRCHAPEMKAAGMVWRHKKVRPKAAVLLLGIFIFLKLPAKANRIATKRNP